MAERSHGVDHFERGLTYLERHQEVIYVEFHRLIETALGAAQPLSHGLQEYRAIPIQLGQ